MRVWLLQESRTLCVYVARVQRKERKKGRKKERKEERKKGRKKEEKKERRKERKKACFSPKKLFFSFSCSTSFLPFFSAPFFGAFLTATYANLVLYPCLLQRERERE